MFKGIIIIIKKYLLTNFFILKINLKKLPSNTEGFDHLNIFFNDNEKFKNDILSNNYFKKNIIKEKAIYYNSFDWLITAKKIGGAESLYFSRNQLKIWNDNLPKLFSFFWNNKYCSKRLINLIYSYDFFAISSKSEEKIFFNKLIYKHFIINNIYVTSFPLEKISIEDTKANLLLCLIYKKKIDNIVAKIKKQIDLNIDISGFHKSYNPLFQAEYINNLIEIKNILLFFNKDLFPELDFKIINMTSLLNNLFHKDSTIALFNGSHNSFNNEILKIIEQCEDIKLKKLYSLNNGLATYGDKDKKIFFDIVKPTNKFINRNLHAGTLSFEFSCNKEKIITNCGSIKKQYSKKPEYLRYSAAHSTIILNNTNISELSNKKSYLRIPKNINYDHLENDNEIVFNCMHDGYKENFKKIVKRKIIVKKNINSIFGEDSIIPIKLYSKKILYNIRFHLMPHCQCNITRGKKKVIIKTKSLNTWIFESSSEISIEESIFIEKGSKIQQNKQIVITGFVGQTKKIEHWSFKSS